MKLSVIIVSYNVKYYLAQCLRSVEKAIGVLECGQQGDANGDTAEIIVVDNHSQDGTVEYLEHCFPASRYPNLHVVACTHSNVSGRADNRSTPKSESEPVLLLNPDTIIGEHVLKDAVSFMRSHPHAGALGVRMAKVMGNWTGFSLQLYKNLFAEGTHHSLTAALVNTVTIALITATVSTLFGTLTAIGIYNLRNRYARNAIQFVNNIPILNGDIIIGISLFLLFITLGIPQGYTTVVLSHITFCLPYVILSVMPRLKQMNPNLYEAALDLGASPMQALRKVIIPEILPGMISGFMLAITMSIDDFAVTIFTIGNEGLETLSTFIYADARKGGLTPELRPLSTIIFALVLVMLIIINKRSEKNKKK